MTSATHSERERFCFDLSRFAPKSQARHAQRLMRYASTYWKLTEKRNKDLLAMSPRELSKLKLTRIAVTRICDEIDAVPVFGYALNLSIDTGEWQQIVRIPCI